MTRRSWTRLAVVVSAVAALVLAPATAASAHPLGNFTVSRYTGLTVAVDHAVIDHVVDLAEVPTAQLGDDVSDLDAVGAAQCADAAEGLELRVGADTVPLEVATSTATTSPGQLELAVLRVTCGLRGSYDSLSADTPVSLQEQVDGVEMGWHEITARGDGVTLTEASVPEASQSDRLSAYPEDLLDSPLDVRNATLLASPGGTTAALDAGAAEGSGGLPAGAGAVDRFTAVVADMLDNPGVGWLLIAVAAALALGAVHALAPGHGKTVMALYLASGETRSLRAALRVGFTVTAAHTASVVALAVLVASGSSVVPERVYPVLTAISGLLVLWLGVGLVRRVRRGEGTGHGQGHGHGHGHGHAHGHEPAVDAAESPARRWGNLATLGVAGGVIPSPSALLLLLAAVALGRPWFGAALVGAFGVGMAITLCSVGLLAADVLARVSAWVPRTRSRWARLTRLTVAYGGAAGVCAVGAGLMLRSVLLV